MEMLAYIYLARKWPKLIRHWFEVEEAMRKAHNYHSKPLGSRIKIQLLVYMVLVTGALKFLILVQTYTYFLIFLVVYATLISNNLPKDGSFKSLFVVYNPVHAQRNYSLCYAILHQVTCP